MRVLFDADDPGSDDELKVNKDYATNYDAWRQKEELNKLKTKYGDANGDIITDSTNDSTSEEEDEDGNVVKFDREFYKTLACLKTKDPRLYDGKTSFFQPNTNDDKKDDDKSKKKESKKEKALSLRDYERKIILEREGKLSDSEDEEVFKQKKEASHVPTYVEEQHRIKESFKHALCDEEEEDKDNLLKIKEKSEDEKQQEQEDYKEWLKGQKLEIDETEQQELKPLRDYWNDPDLDANEKFLRDYILNDKFRDKDFTDDYEDDRRIHDSDENLSADEETIEKQEEFEHKYNFRFEEPDKEFIKRYPRTMETSMRKKDTRRAQKRQELKKRKEEDKIRKQEELKQLKALKKKEIEEKIEKIKEVTGNDDVCFNDDDFDADFDPEEHDRKMTEMFNENYYATTEDDIKPEFPDIDEELEIENNWDDYDVNDDAGPSSSYDNGPHCEDEDFNMDADYCDSQNVQSKNTEVENKKRRGKKRSKFAELIAKKKPKYDPKEHSSYLDYFDRYYSLDYEDMIGDMPCRFKYRKVVPNDYGLSVEEILIADDKELNKWCSLKRALRYKPDHAEINDVQMYQRKGQNEMLKRKVLRSLYATQEEEEAENVDEDTQDDTKSKKKRRRKITAEDQDITVETKNESQSNQTDTQQEITNSMETNETEKIKSKKKKKRPGNAHQDVPQNKKLKIENSHNHESETVKTQTNNNPDIKIKNTSVDVTRNKTKKLENSKKFHKKGKKQKLSKDVEQVMSINAERLKGYGINAKKFKNKLLYKNYKNPNNKSHPRKDKK